MFRILCQASNLDKVAERYPQSGEPGWEPGISQATAALDEHLLDLQQELSTQQLLHYTVFHKEIC